MEYFINKYIDQNQSLLSDMVEAEDKGNVIAVGKYAEGGLIVEIDDIGNVIWNKSYTIKGQKIVFLKCIEASNNEYVLLGQYAVSTKQRVNYLVLRVDKNGLILWIKRIFTSKTRYSTEVVRVGNDYYVSGWHNIINKNDEVEIHRISTIGDIKQSTVLKFGRDDQLHGMTRAGGLINVYGGTSAGGGWNGFFTLVNPDLVKGKSLTYLFGSSNKATRENILAVHYSNSINKKPSNYLVAGHTVKGGATETFIAEVKQVETSLSVVKSICLNITNGNDHIIKILSHKQFVYVLGRRIDNEYSFILKLDINFRLVWAKRFELEEKESLRDIIINEKDVVWISGDVVSSQSRDALLIKTDLDLTTCKTVDIKGLEIKDFDLVIRKTDTAQRGVEIEQESLKVNMDEVRLEKVSICPTTTFELSDDQWVQSPYMYLQSAGSLGQDATQGILLRWFLLRNLGKSHLPKGNNATTTNGFNKPDDFVRIYKAKYDVRQQRELNFRVHSPTHIENTERKWVYIIEEQVYYLFFKDEQKYDAVLAQSNPANNSFQFLNAYGNGLLELEIRDRLAFSVEFGIHSITGAAIFNLKVETYSVQGNMHLEEEAISSRTSLDQTSPALRIVEENIRRIKFTIDFMSVVSLKFEMYSDFLNVKLESSGWEDLGAFALSTDTNEVFKRLEDTSRMTINGHWQKYNEDAFVNVQNYKDRWNEPVDGLSNGVSKYIQLSDTDPYAVDTALEEIDGGTDLEISYFDLLNIVSLDYHASRMLGLGHIDTPNSSESDQFIYLAEYITHDQLDYFQNPESKQHLYLSLPTSIQQERMPQSLKTLPVEYGLNLYTGSDQDFQLTDDNGYVPYAPLRYVGVKAEILQDNSINNGFFNPSTHFSSSEYSAPVFAGIEYKKQGESNWRKPEISHDASFKDSSALQTLETIPIPFSDDSTKPLLIHKETEEGIAEYAAYSCNIFSRAVPTHNSVFTDFTKFTKPNTLLPPHNLNVQLIQEESPLMLTSGNEQVMLNALSGDKTLVRLTFLYTHLHDVNYGFGDKIEVFFRDHLPRNMVGGVNNIQDDSNDQYSIIATQAYTYNSNGQTIVPNIPSAFIDNFKGGVLVVNEARYHIEDIIMTNGNGDFPKLKIKKQEDRNTVDLGGGNIVTTVDYVAPNVSNGDLFMIIENMAIDQSWGAANPLNFDIEIDDAQWSTKSESFVDTDMTIIQNIRGIWDTANITPRAGSAVGVYDVKFDTIQLNHHNQFNAASGVNSVDWYKGVIRIRIVDDSSGTMERKVLDVVSIVNIDSGQNLELIVHDEAFDTGTLGNNIQIGNSIEVNFYPGFRAYFHKDDPSGFNEASVMPAIGDGSKKTLIGLRTIDTTTQDSLGDDYHSSIGIPQILFAQEIIAPEKPKDPSGPDYATPPDFNGRSTFTFTTKFRAETYAAIYYRADVNAILKALYTQDKIEDIRSILPAIDEDGVYTDRFKDIVGFDYTEGTFTKFPLGSGDYHLPNPNNIENGFDAGGADNPSTIVDKIKKAIYNSFVPLTEQPLIYSFIKGGNYIPLPKKQKIRDKYGKLLAPDDAEYDQAPMAKKLSGQEVRFTDFTLDGEMSKETTYFYMVREMGNRMALSEPSKVLGPIQLINTNAPEAPVIRKVTTQLSDPILGVDTAVNFDINAYPASQNIKKIRIYRSINAVDALTPRTMDMVKEFDVTPSIITDGVIHIYDDFQFNGFLPFGEALYYKIVACREVKYIDLDSNLIEDYVPSKPSKTLLSNIVDNTNPSPPQITETIGSTTPAELSGLVLNWDNTAHNAKYYLFKMNNTGNWNKIFEIKSNDEIDLEYAFSDPVPKVDDDNNTIYHRFKVSVENSSGLLNLEEKILTL